MSSSDGSVNPRVFPGKPNVVPSYKTPAPTTTSTTTTTTISTTTTSTGLFNPGFNATNVTTGVEVTTVQTYAGGQTEVTTGQSVVITRHYTLCAPFPPCDPLGCGPNTAPIECDECSQPTVAFTIFLMCLLSVLIVFTNVLVIVIIARNASLRRRHGYIKMSLAFSDLLIGLFVIPAAVYNMATTLYLPREQEPSFPVRGRLWKPASNDALEFAARNSLASVFFGTVLIVSVTSSIYNLLLLSLDRFLAIAKPLQSHSGKYFTKRRLRICLITVWMLGIILSSLPAFIPSQFAYELDGTTFFYIQSTTSSHDSSQGVGPIAFFSLFVMGIPYILIVFLNVSTLVMTVKKLKFRKRHSSSRYVSSSKSDSAKRMKEMMDSYPEMKYGNRKRFPIAGLFGRNNSNNNPGRLSRERLESANSVFSRMKSTKNPVDNVSSRVQMMISTMVAAFTVCICPYIIVNAMLANGTLNCSNVGVPYNVGIYFVMINSAVNFFIYNLWHREFRVRLCSAIRGKPVSSSRNASSPNGIVISSDRPRYSSGQVSTFARETAARYHMRKMGGVSSFKQPANVESEL